MPTLQTTMNRKNSKPQINVTINDTNSPIEDNSPGEFAALFLSYKNFVNFNEVTMTLIMYLRKSNSNVSLTLS